MHFYGFSQHAMLFQKGNLASDNTGNTYAFLCNTKFGIDTYWYSHEDALKCNGELCACLKELQYARFNRFHIK